MISLITYSVFMLLVIVKYTMFPNFISLHLIGHLLNLFILSNKIIDPVQVHKAFLLCSYVAYEINHVIIFVMGFFSLGDGAFQVGPIATQQSPFS
jgi:hypothetical protein